MNKALKILLPALLVPAVMLLLIVPAYLAGYSHAKARGLAALEEERLQREQAVADWRHELNERLREQARRAFLADLALQKERSNHAQEKRKLLDKVGRAAGGGCVFGADFVSLWNQAVNAPHGAALPSAPDSGIPDDAAGSAPASAGQR